MEESEVEKVEVVDGGAGGQRGSPTARRWRGAPDR